MRETLIFLLEIEIINRIQKRVFGMVNTVLIRRKYVWVFLEILFVNQAVQHLLNCSFYFRNSTFAT